ncbi:MAG: hypothetical protein WAP55_01145, partial [Minisyncoccia bacterium]
GTERIRRLKAANHIRLDAQIFQTLWENKHRIPEGWKEKINGNTTYIFFDGTSLRSPDGFRGALCLDWFGGEWHWDYCWLEDGLDDEDPSAVLASLPAAA